MSEKLKLNDQTPNTNDDDYGSLGTGDLRSWMTIVADKDHSGTKTINEAVNQVTSADALDFLQRINSYLIGSSFAKKSPLFGDGTQRMMFGWSFAGNKNFIAPELSLSKELLSEYLDVIKTIGDKKKRALLSYYAINNLHLFSDGNGRTARAIYLLMMGESLVNHKDVLIHKEIVDWRTGKYKSNDSDDRLRWSFLLNNKIKSVEAINTVANILLQEELIEKGSLSNKLRDIRISSLSATRGIVRPDFPNRVQQELSQEETQGLYYAFSDGIQNRSCSTLSGLTLASVLYLRGTLEMNFDDNLESEDELIFRVNYDEADCYDTNLVNRVHKLFDDWQAKDCRDFLRIYQSLKRRQNEIIMSIFSENRCFCDGYSIAEWAMDGFSASSVNMPEEQKNSMMAKFLQYDLDI